MKLLMMYMYSIEITVEYGKTFETKKTLVSKERTSMLVITYKAIVSTTNG